MPERDDKSKPGFFGGYWLEQKPGRSSGIWYRTWYDRGGHQIRRISTGERDFQAAHTALVTWVVDNERPHNAPRASALIDSIALHYWTDHAQHRPSAETARRELGLIQGWWEGKTVADITPDAQRRFRAHLASLGTGKGGVDRILSTFRAALNHARKNEEVESVPFISGFRTSEELRSREPKGRPLTIDELAALVDASRSNHILMYLIIAIGTLARLGAVLDMAAAQYDEAAAVLNLNPTGRPQNKKWRPVIPVVPTLAKWLTGTADPQTGLFVTFKGRQIASILAGFRLTRAAAKLDERVTPYSIRHTMAREMRRRGVPGDQISLFLGHLPQGAAATTAIYAPYEPGYLHDAAEAIEDVYREMAGGVLSADVLGGPTFALGLDHTEAQTRAVMDGKSLRRGVGEPAREEVRNLIREGVTHAEIKRMTGLSDGTISTIRQAMKRDGGLRRPTK